MKENENLQHQGHTLIFDFHGNFINNISRLFCDIFSLFFKYLLSTSIHYIYPIYSIYCILSILFCLLYLFYIYLTFFLWPFFSFFTSFSFLHQFTTFILAILSNLSNLFYIYFTTFLWQLFSLLQVSLSNIYFVCGVFLSIFSMSFTYNNFSN